MDQLRQRRRYPRTMANQQIFTMKQVADRLNIGRTTLFRILRDQHILNQENIALDYYVRAGLFRIEIKHYWHPKLREHIPTGTTKVTRKGVEFIRQRISAPPSVGQANPYAVI